MVRPIRFACAALITVVASTILAAAAAADNRPIALRPNAQEQLTISPSSVIIALQKVARKPVVINVINSNGEEVTDGPTEVLSTNISVPLKYGLPRGTYTVTYRVESDRGPEGGKYQYSYGPAKFTIKGVKTWVGYSEMPKSMRLTGDAKKASATPPTATPTTSATDSPSPAPSDKEVRNASDDTGSWSSIWPSVAVFALLVACLALFIRGRKGVHPKDGPTL